LKNSENPWIETYTGKKFYILNPRQEDIDIEDIAHALSMLCRFVGHCKQFYSVAEHSVRLSLLQVVYQHIRHSRVVLTQTRLIALLHDAAEAYLGDVSSPLKLVLPKYQSYESRLQSLIFKNFLGYSPLEEIRYIKMAERMLLATELRDVVDAKTDWHEYEAKLGINQLLKPLPEKICPLSQIDAKNSFLERFNHLRKRKGA